MEAVLVELAFRPLQAERALAVFLTSTRMANKASPFQVCLMKNRTTELALVGLRVVVVEENGRSGGNQSVPAVGVTGMTGRYTSHFQPCGPGDFGCVWELAATRDNNEFTSGQPFLAPSRVARSWAWPRTGVSTKMMGGVEGAAG